MKYNRLAEVACDARKRAELSQATVGLALKRSRAWVADLERGKVTFETLDEVRAFAEVTGASIVDLSRWAFDGLLAKFNAVRDLLDMALAAEFASRLRDIAVTRAGSGDDAGALSALSAAAEMQRFCR